MSYKIVNYSNLNVFLEDLGIRLNGKGASAVISENDYSKSKSLKELSGLVTITKNTPPNLSYSKRPYITIPVNNVPLETSRQDIKKEKAFVAPKISTPESPKSETSSFPPVNLPSIDSQKIDRIEQLLVTMTNVLERISTISPVMAVPQNVGTLGSNNKIDDVYIPKNVVPENVDFNINMKEGSQVRPEIEEASKTLKKMRSKK